MDTQDLSSQRCGCCKYLFSIEDNIYTLFNFIAQSLDLFDGSVFVTEPNQHISFISRFSINVFNRLTQIFSSQDVTFSGFLPGFGIILIWDIFQVAEKQFVLNIALLFQFFPQFETFRGHIQIYLLFSRMESRNFRRFSIIHIQVK